MSQAGPGNESDALKSERGDSVIKKILLLLLLAAFVAVATEMLSQNPASQTQPATSKTPATPEKTPPATVSCAWQGGRDAGGWWQRGDWQQRLVQQVVSDLQCLSDVQPRRPDRPQGVGRRAVLVTLFRDNKVPAVRGREVDRRFRRRRPERREGRCGGADRQPSDGCQAANCRRRAGGRQGYGKQQRRDRCGDQGRGSLAGVARSDRRYSRAKNPNAVSLFERRKTYFEHEKAKSQVSRPPTKKRSPA